MNNKITALQALMQLIKGSFGAGILAMPKSFSYSGFVVGLICTPIIGIIGASRMHALVNMNTLICDKLNIPSMEYPDIAEKALIIGPKSLRKYSNIAKCLISWFIILSIYGYCCSYYLFAVDNIKKFALSLNYSFLNLSTQTYLAIFLPFIILLNFIKSIKSLSYAAMLANILQLSSLLIICYNLTNDTPKLSEREAVGKQFSLYFSTTVFTFESICFIMPLYNSMKKPQDFTKMFGVINIAITIIIILYTSFGFLGYLKYGHDVEAVITLSLPEESLYKYVILVYGIAISISYPWQMYVLIQLLWPKLKTKLKAMNMSETQINVSDYFFRAILVTLTYAFVASIPKLGSVIALIGSVSCSSIFIILPSILHIIAFWEERKGFLARLWLCLSNLTIMFIGLLGFATGFYYSILSIIE